MTTPFHQPPEHLAPIADPASVDAAIERRVSIRAFLPTPVPRAVLEAILRVASRAPSGNNAQPWHVYVLEGATKDDLARKVLDADNARREHPELETRYRPDYDYYPRHWVEPYLARRRANGWGLYGLLGIGRTDKDQMRAQQQRNLCFFDAPVGLMLTLDRVMGQGSLLDSGMFIQNLMLAARARGLATCPQAAWNEYSSIVLPHIGAAAEEYLVCSVALGYPDPAAPVNAFFTPREPLENFVHWVKQGNAE
ncbi:MAG: nitroreductase [Burkholderiaceae bacterium]|jgi:nitroreductase|nr:nitroreductase [Burkholderiaceae bacterium]